MRSNHSTLKFVYLNEENLSQGTKPISLRDIIMHNLGGFSNVMPFNHQHLEE